MWSLALAALTLAAAVIVGVATRSGRDAPAAPIVYPPPAPQPPRKLVELHIVTRPVGVAVVLDHQFLGLTPLVVTVPRPEAPVTLSLQHPAYKELVKRLALRDDTRLRLALTPTGAPPVHQGRYKDAQCMSCHRPRLAP